MNEIQVFSNAELGEVRTTVLDGEVMFVGKDVAEILGYSTIQRMQLQLMSMRKTGL